MTVSVRYVGLFDEVTINAISPAGVPVAVQVSAGEIVDAPDWLAGEPPAGDSAGFGLLAQPANWAPAIPIDDVHAPVDDQSTGDPGETGATQ